MTEGSLQDQAFLVTGGGTGIGLSVVLECIQAHDGSVELVDSDEFRGAHFRVHIPQERAVAKQKLAVNG